MMFGDIQQSEIRKRYFALPLQKTMVRTVGY